MAKTNAKSKRVLLLGASFDTGNMGVSALAASAVKCIKKTYPEAAIVMLGYGSKDGSYELQLADKKIHLQILNMSFSKRIWSSDHYVWQFLLALIYRLSLWNGLKKKIAETSRYLNTILESDVCFDISAGDSFSDIYGLYRLFYVSSCKWLVLLLGRKLVLLPQTYGPFRKRISRKLAKYILKRTHRVYSRDIPSAEFVKNLLKYDGAINGKVKVLPDIAFVLDSQRPRTSEFVDLEILRRKKEKGGVVVGLNVSGLLFNDGYTRSNMFGLKVNYRKIVYEVIDLFARREGVSVLLVPHVFVPVDNPESDAAVCLEIYREQKAKYKGELFCVNGKFNQSEIKYVIGMCDFFVGSRMHACIAALSQCIPAIGLAYSRKFSGTFATLGMERYALDLCQREESEVLDLIMKTFEQRNTISAELKVVVPEVQKKLMDEVKKGFAE
ncbi:MAG: polysaccharide pyruvyl transferase family protein [Planctomycetota bacterium]